MTESPLAGRIVLVVDDHHEMLDFLRTVFHDAGAHVRTSAAPERALAIVMRDRVDAIVCDLKMPGVDGLEWIRRARESGDRGRVPALALTGDVAYCEPRAAIASGFDEVALKPIAPRAIVDLVASMLAGGGGRGGGRRRTTTTSLPRIP